MMGIFKRKHRHEWALIHHKSTKVVLTDDGSKSNVPVIVRLYKCPCGAERADMSPQLIDKGNPYLGHLFKDIDPLYYRDMFMPKDTHDNAV
jgi:hypothetical protein